MVGRGPAVAQKKGVYDERADRLQMVHSHIESFVAPEIMKNRLLQPFRCSPFNDELPPLHTLLKQRQFEEIMEILQFRSNKRLALWLSHANIVQSVLKFKPSYELLDVLLCKMAELERGFIPEDTVDECGRTPLHIATRLCLPCNIIQRLTKNSDMAAVTMDEYGRLPLHYACEKRSRGKTSNQIETILLLLDVYPQAALFRDANGHTPLYLATQNKLDQRIISAISEVHHLLWKRTWNTMLSETKCTLPSNESWPMEMSTVLEVAEEADDDMSSLGSGSATRPPGNIDPVSPYERVFWI